MTVAQIHFEISCTQDFLILPLKGQTLENGHTFDMKTNMCQMFSLEESVFEISQPEHSPFNSFKFTEKWNNQSKF